MDDVKKKVYLDLFASPGTLIPTATGLTALMASWATTGNPALTLAGVAGVLVGAGIFATRLILGLDDITQRAYDHVVQQQQREQLKALEHLRQRLLQDQDPRTQRCLVELWQLYSQVKTKAEQEEISPASFDVIERIDQLFTTCVRQLEHSVDLWETARTLRGAGRENVLQQRNEIVDEICDAVIHLSETVDKFHAVKTNRNRNELAQVRRELDESMEVARRVEQRTEELTDRPSLDFDGPTNE